MKWDSGLFCLHTILQLRNRQADPAQLRHTFGNSDGKLEITDIQRALKQHDFKVKQQTLKPEELRNELLPAILIDRSGSPFVLLNQKIREGETRYLVAHSKSPESISSVQLENLWSGETLLATDMHSTQGFNQRFELNWFIPALKKYKKLFAEILIISVFLQLFALATPLFFQIVMDKVLVHRGFTTLDILAIAFVGIAFFDATLGAIRNYLFSHTASRIDVELGAKLYDHLMKLPLAYFQNRPVGHSVARVKELDSLREFLTGTALTLTIDLSFTLIFIAVLWLYSPTLTWVVVGAIPLYILLSILITPSLRARLNESFRRGAENQAFLVESISGVETIKSMALEPKLQTRWEGQLAHYVKAGFRSQNLNNIASQVAGLISKLTTILIIWFGSHLVIDGALTVGELVAFNMIAQRVSAPILKLVQLWQDFQQAGISLKRLAEILDTPTESQLSTSRTSIPGFKGDISFNSVTFGYKPDTPATLKSISFNIKAGESIGIVGSSGSGKSTLTKLVQRMYLPNQGRVLVDGVDLSMVNIDWLRSNIGVVPQESFLFNKSIRENISVRAPFASIEQITHAAKMAGAHDFICALPEGYDTITGERGSNLSGGQRQRIAIARALLTNPKILIFDEATSALDYESEFELQRNMESIRKGRTVITIAHRLSAVARCDRIFVLNQGQIVEQGGHDALIKSKGMYAKLFAIQQNLALPEQIGTAHGGAV